MISLRSAAAKKLLPYKHTAFVMNDDTIYYPEQQSPFEYLKYHEDQEDEFVSSNHVIDPSNVTKYWYVHPATMSITKSMYAEWCEQQKRNVKSELRKNYLTHLCSEKLEEMWKCNQVYPLCRQQRSLVHNKQKYFKILRQTEYNDDIQSYIQITTFTSQIKIDDLDLFEEHRLPFRTLRLDHMLELAFNLEQRQGQNCIITPGAILKEHYVGAERAKQMPYPLPFWYECVKISDSGLTFAAAESCVSKNTVAVAYVASLFLFGFEKTNWPQGWQALVKMAKQRERKQKQAQEEKQIVEQELKKAEAEMDGKRKKKEEKKEKEKRAGTLVKYANEWLKQAIKFYLPKVDLTLSPLKELNLEHTLSGIDRLQIISNIGLLKLESFKQEASKAEAAAAAAAPDAAPAAAPAATEEATKAKEAKLKFQSAKNHFEHNMQQLWLQVLNEERMQRDDWKTAIGLDGSRQFAKKMQLIAFKFVDTISDKATDHYSLGNFKKTTLVDGCGRPMCLGLYEEYTFDEDTQEGEEEDTQEGEEDVSSMIPRFPISPEQEEEEVEVDKEVCGCGTRSLGFQTPWFEFEFCQVIKRQSGINSVRDLQEKTKNEVEKANNDPKLCFQSHETFLFEPKHDELSILRQRVQAFEPDDSAANFPIPFYRLIIDTQVCAGTLKAIYYALSLLADSYSLNISRSINVVYDKMLPSFVLPAGQNLNLPQAFCFLNLNLSAAATQITFNNLPEKQPPEISALGQPSTQIARAKDKFTEKDEQVAATELQKELERKQTLAIEPSQSLQDKISAVFSIEAPTSYINIMLFCAKLQPHLYTREWVRYYTRLKLEDIQTEIRKPFVQLPVENDQALIVTLNTLMKKNKKL